MRYDESHIQEAVVRHIRSEYPNVLVTCAPATAKNVQQGSRNKRMGLLKGWPDLFIAYPNNGYNGLFIELKTETGKINKEQIALIHRLNALGYYSAICYGYDEAVEIIKHYFKK